MLPQGGAKRSQMKNGAEVLGARDLGRRGVTLLAASTLAQTASMAARSSNRFCFFSFALLDFLCNREKQSWLEGLWPTKDLTFLLRNLRVSPRVHSLASVAGTSNPGGCTLGGLGKTQASSSRGSLGASPDFSASLSEEY